MDPQIQTHDDNQLPSLSLPSTWISYLLLGCLVGLSQAGGIGGGPIISPVMMLLLNLNNKKAIWNTYIMLLGGSIGNYLRLGAERTKSGSSPLINYDLVMITLPLLLAGAVLGVASGRWLPKIIIAIFLFIILISVFLKTYSLYNTMRSREQHADSIELHEIEEALIPNSQLFLIQEKEKELYPAAQMKEMGLQILIVLVISLLKGSSQFKSFIGLEYCGEGYHALNALILIIALYNVNRYRINLRCEEIYKESVGYQFLDGRMTPLISSTVKTSFFAGFLGGLVGLGGGVVLTPLWLSMGIPSPRATASATFCVFFTSFIAVFLTAIQGGYILEEIIILGLVSSCGSYLVAGQLKYIVHKYKRESILIQVLLGVIAFGLCILPFNSIKDIVTNPHEAALFGRFC